MINGVKTKQLKVISDERGWISEILRCDDDLFDKFGQVYLSVAYKERVKAWHYHKIQTDNFTCVKGMMKVVLYDDRENSPTKGEISEYFIGERSPILISVPPRVWHGFKAIDEAAYFISIPNFPYNYNEPDEYRLPPDTDKIPYDWGLVIGLKHG
jgi:dTDP-4-dehydrorhamnose 3,5-epimerase